jgi:hypothetical protein
MISPRISKGSTRRLNANRPTLFNAWTAPNSPEIEILSTQTAWRAIGRSVMGIPSNVEMIRAYYGRSHSSTAADDGAGSDDRLDVEKATLPCVPIDWRDVTNYGYVDLRVMTPLGNRYADPRS